MDCTTQVGGAKVRVSRVFVHTQQQGAAASIHTYDALSHRHHHHLNNNHTCQVSA